MDSENAAHPDTQTHLVMTAEGFDEGDRSALHERHPVMRQLRRVTTHDLRNSSSPQVLLRFKHLL